MNHLHDALAADSSRPLAFILAGQSNMAGLGNPREIPEKYLTPLPSVTFYVEGNQASLGGQEFFGPEVSFARRMAQAYPGRRILIIKSACGGTSLLAWSPEWSAEKADLTRNADAGPLYEKLIREAHQALGEVLRADGFVWMQGERDAKFPSVAKNYGTNLINLFTRLRRDFHAGQAPLVLGIANPSPHSHPGVSDVQIAQRLTEKTLSPALAVSTEGLSKQTDNLHYDTQGVLDLGHALAEAMLHLLNHEVE